MSTGFTQKHGVFKSDKGGDKKVYVTSGELQWVGLVSGPLDACQKALSKGNDKKLDGYFFYIDERGFRTDNAEFKVPVEEGLSHAGYVFDDPDDADD